MCDVLDRVENKGIAIGKAEGEMNKAKETALRMKEKGYDINEIADLINVSVALIKQWLGAATA